MANFTRSQDGTMRATLRGKIRVDRRELDEIAVLASHLGLSVKGLLDRCLREGLREEMDIASGGEKR